MCFTRRRRATSHCSPTSIPPGKKVSTRMFYLSLWGLVVLCLGACVTTSCPSPSCRCRKRASSLPLAWALRLLLPYPVHLPHSSARSNPTSMSLFPHPRFSWGLTDYLKKLFHSFIFFFYGTHTCANMDNHTLTLPCHTISITKH